MNEWLVTHQDATGFFTTSGGYTNSVMRTAFGVNILQAVQIPGPDQVPEPATLALLAIGLMGLGWTTRRSNAGA